MENDITKIEKCPACLSQHWSRLGEKNGFSLYRCDILIGGCGGISILPTPELDAGLYDSDYFCADQSERGYIDYERDKKAMRAELMADLADIASHYPQKGRLLDVGAATGYFLSMARDEGWEVEGIELSAQAAKKAFEKGINVHSGTLTHFPENTKTFDVITLLDVLEHMPEPNDDFTVINRIIKHGGLVVIVTPDTGSFYARLRGLSWHLLIPPEHIHCFSRYGISIFLKRHGYEIISMRSARKRFTLSYALHVISRASGFAFFNRIALFLAGKKIGTLAVPLNVKDNLFVIARRVS